MEDTLLLTHHTGILLSQPAVGYLYPPPPLLRLRQCYPTLQNYFLITTTKCKAQ